MPRGLNLLKAPAALRQRQHRPFAVVNGSAAGWPLQAAKAKAKKYMESDGDDYDLSEGSDDEFAAKRKVCPQNEAPWRCRSSVVMSLTPWLQADQLLDVFCTAACRHQGPADVTKAS